MFNRYVILKLLAVAGVVLLLLQYFPSISYDVTQILTNSNVVPEVVENTSISANDSQFLLDDESENNDLRTETICGQSVKSIVDSETNVIFFPKTGSKVPIFQGDESVLNKGGWIRPNSDLSLTRGNFIVAAHRFVYYQNIYENFYFLDKLEVGDCIVLCWNDTVKFYIVREITEVEPEDVSIENRGFDPELTLYTCTPLGISTKRLVVKAVPITVIK